LHTKPRSAYHRRRQENARAFVHEGRPGCAVYCVWPLYQLQRPGAFVDDLNVHLRNAGGERYANHNCVRDTLLELFRAGDFTCRSGGREVCLACEPETKKCVDLTVDGFDGLAALGDDVSRTDPR
jgi:hypothetical protein